MCLFQLPEVLLQVIFPVAFYCELLETFCGREFPVKQTKKTLSSSSRCLTENQRVELSWKCFEIVQMVKAVFMPSGLAGDRIVALKARLSKPMLFFKVCLIAAVDVIPPMDNSYAVNSRQSIISRP